MLTPYDLGRHDAECGMLCVPEMYFVRKAQISAYVMGYMTVNPFSILAQQLLRQLQIAA